MYEDILFIKIIVLGLISGLFSVDNVDILFRVPAVIFYGVGTYVLLDAHIKKNRNWKGWKKTGFKKEDKDKYGIE